MNSKKKDEHLIGLHIYEDDRGRCVFYNIFNKKAYLITASDDFKSYALYQTRLAFAILAGFVVLSFLEMPILAIVLGVGIYVVLTVMFYTRFVSRLQVAKGFDIDSQDSFLVRYAARMTETRIIITTILLIALCILIILNVKVSDFDQMTVILNYIVSACAGVGSVIMVYTYILKKRTTDKGGKKDERHHID